MDYITITGAKTNNLKDINVKIPKGKITVITGLSGSGKSSLAFDTIYAEGHRRYVENLSSFAKQILGVLDKPDIESADGLIPAIAIDQKTIARSPRSTVGTLTEIYDYLRLLMAKAGIPKCASCHTKLKKNVPDEIISNAQKVLKENDNLIIFVPIAHNQSCEQFKKTLKKIAASKYKQVYINGSLFDTNNVNLFDCKDDEFYTAEIIYANVEKQGENQISLKGIIDRALNIGSGRIKISHNEDLSSAKEYTINLTCPECDAVFPQISPKLFSFNSPHGACLECHGLGRKKYIDPNLIIPNQQLTLAEGAIRPWSRMANQTPWYDKTLRELAVRNNFDLNTPVYQLSDENKSKVLYGDGVFEGVVNNLERRYVETDSDYLRGEIDKYMIERICPACGGKRLRGEALAITIKNKNIADLSTMSVSTLHNFLSEIPFGDNEVVKPIVDEIIKRLNNLNQVGLTYLTIDRQADSLAGGEAQRIRLATQLNGSLSGVLYVLDEPSIGLHPSDVEKLIDTLKKLKEQGNTLIVVEHDEKIMKAADYIIDIGPLAGELGGNIVAQGRFSDIVKSDSLTSQYLSGRKRIKIPEERRKFSNDSIKITGAAEHNLKNIDVTIPLNVLACITGVSGSGKSTLIYDILANKVAEYFHRAIVTVGKHKKITGLENLNKAINIDQSPIGRTPRSNLATFTGIFGPIRSLFADQTEAKLKGFTASHFSFNLKGGRCEACHGDGMIKVEMHFLPDVYVTCEQCGGKRYNADALEVTYKNVNIADVLDMTVDRAMEFFKGEEQITEKLTILQAVGLGYVRLGQSATTLSGGEAQRIKLATELSRSDTGKTLYILDEPTTGLHFEDVAMLLAVLQRLVEKGNTVLVIEHNLDVIKCADYIVDIGPEGGEKGGKVVATGTPEQVSKIKESLTGQYLKPILS